jgi:hypothetical protein
VEIIEDGANRLLFTAGDAGDLADKVRWASWRPQAMRDMGVRARRVYETKILACRQFGATDKNTRRRSPGHDRPRSARYQD